MKLVQYTPSEPARPYRSNKLPQCSHKNVHPFVSKAIKIHRGKGLFKKKVDKDTCIVLKRLLSVCLMGITICIQTSKYHCEF